MKIISDSVHSKNPTAPLSPPDRKLHHPVLQAITWYSKRGNESYAHPPVLHQNGAARCFISSGNPQSHRVIQACRNNRLGDPEQTWGARLAPVSGVAAHLPHNRLCVSRRLPCSHLGKDMAPKRDCHRLAARLSGHDLHREGLPQPLPIPVQPGELTRKGAGHSFKSVCRLKAHPRWVCWLVTNVRVSNCQIHCCHFSYFRHLYGVWGCMHVTVYT